MLSFSSLCFLSRVWPACAARQYREQDVPVLIIAPVESDPADRFNKVWQYDLANNIITIGWGELGDASKMSRQQLPKLWHRVTQRVRRVS